MLVAGLLRAFHVIDLTGEPLPSKDQTDSLSARVKSHLPLPLLPRDSSNSLQLPDFPGRSPIDRLRDRKKSRGDNRHFSESGDKSGSITGQQSGNCELLQTSAFSTYGNGNSTCPCVKHGHCWTMKRTCVDQVTSKVQLAQLLSNT